MNVSPVFESSSAGSSCRVPCQSRGPEGVAPATNAQTAQLTAGQIGRQTYQSPSQPRLVGAAHEFEAAMMKELMGPLQFGHGTLSGDEDEQGSSSALTSFASEALAKAISDRGGFGIANQIIRQLNPTGNHFGNTPVSAIRTEIP